jgi:nitrite reductase (NADH) large subunit
VKSKEGVDVAYDRLLMATGSNPILLPIPGNKLAGVVTFRDLHDVNTMLQATREHTRATVIGGGLLGLEAANGLKLQGMDVTVVHVCETLMERQLDAAAAKLLQSSLEKRGIHFKLAAKTAAILGDARVTAVQLEDGEVVPTDLLVMAVGIRPNTALAESMKLKPEFNSRASIFDVVTLTGT